MIKKETKTQEGNIAIMNGKMLQEIRESKNISRKRLAEKIYVSESIVQSWEQGWYIELPSSGEIEGMAEFFDIDEQELRKKLELSEEDLDEKPVRFIDFVDAGVRVANYVKNKKDEIK